MSDQCLSTSIIRPYKEFKLWWHRELWWLITWKGLDFQVKSLSVVIESAEVSAGQKEPEKINHLWSISGLQWKEKRGGFTCPLGCKMASASSEERSEGKAEVWGDVGLLTTTPSSPLNLPWGSALSILSLL